MLSRQRRAQGMTVSMRGRNSSALLLHSSQMTRSCSLQIMQCFAGQSLLMYVAVLWIHI